MTAGAGTGPALAIRPMTAADLDRAVDWAAAEGWNPGVDDAPAFRAADPDGFLMGFRGGVPIACISAVGYGASFGFIGFYICRPEERGRGYGLALWQAGLGRLAGRTVGLDGVIAQQDNYRRSGFVLAHRNVRYGGTVAVEAPDDRRLVPIGPAGRAAVMAYDRAFFRAPRETFLEAWLGGGRRRGLAAVEGGTIRGYGVVRPCRSGHKIGPLFAEDDGTADLLFRGLAAGLDGLVYLDPPEPNRAARALAARYGLAPVFETARMYRGTAPDLPLDRMFGITTFELG